MEGIYRRISSVPSLIWTPIYWTILQKDPNTNETNGIELVELKNKLGTKQLPTAELNMNNCKGRIISEDGRGIATISSMFTISRLHNIIRDRMINLKKYFNFEK